MKGCIGAALVFLGVVGIIAFAPGVACAELSTAEKKQLQSLHQAAGYVEQSYWALGDLLRRTTPANRPAVANVWGRLRASSDSINLAIALLVHGNPYQGWQATDLEASGVPTWVRRAWQSLDIAYGNLVALAFSDLPVSGLANTDGIRDRAWWAAQTISRVDRTLTFGNPWPRNYPQVIGPHGDWRAAVNRLGLSVSGFQELHGQAIAAYATDRPLDDYSAFSGIPALIGAVQLRSRMVLLNLALIPLSPQQCAENAFHLVARTLGLLLDDTSHDPGGSPYFFENGFEALLKVYSDNASTRPDFTRAFHRFFIVLQRMWRLQNGAAWSALTFPDPAKLAEIRGQNSIASDPFAGALCTQ